MDSNNYNLKPHNNIYNKPFIVLNSHMLCFLKHQITEMMLKVQVTTLANNKVSWLAFVRLHIKVKNHHMTHWAKGFVSTPLLTSTICYLGVISE